MRVKFTNFFTVISLFLMIVLLSSCNQELDNETDVGDLILVEVDVTTVEREYLLNEFDLSTIKLILTYADERKETINITPAMINALDWQKLSTPGEHTITIVYRGFEREVIIELIDSELTTLLKGIYHLGVSEGVIQDTYQDWLDSIQGEDGIGIENVYLSELGELMVLLTNGEIINIGMVVGAQGEDGKAIELRVSNNYIEWQIEGSNDWEQLFNLNEINAIDGLSAYELYCKYHPEYQGTEEEWVYEYFGTIKDQIERPYGIFIPRVLSASNLQEGTLITVVGTLRYTQYASGEGGAFIYHNEFSIEDSNIGVTFNIEADAFTSVLMDYVDKMVRINVYYYQGDDAHYGLFHGGANAVNEDNGAYELLVYANHMVSHISFQGRKNLTLPSFENDAGYVGDWQSQNINVYDHQGVFINHPSATGNHVFKGVLKLDNYERELTLTVETYRVTKLLELPYIEDNTKVLIQGIAYGRIRQTGNSTSAFLYDGTGYGHVYHVEFLADKRIGIGDGTEVEILTTKSTFLSMADYFTGIPTTIQFINIDYLENHFDMPEIIGPLSVSELAETDITSGTPIIIRGTYQIYYDTDDDITTTVHQIGDVSQKLFYTFALNHYPEELEALNQMIEITGIYFKESQTILLTEPIKIIEDDTGMPTEDVEGIDIVSVPRYPDSIRVYYNYYEESYEGEFYEVEYLTEDQMSDVIDFYTNHFQKMEWSIKESGYIIEEVYAISATLADEEVIIFMAFDLNFPHLVRIAIHYENIYLVPH